MSAKYYNPDCDVALVTNNPLPVSYAVLFADHGIKVMEAAFDNYHVPDGFMWEYAFYKLKALEYIVNNTDYDCVLGLDSDTYISGSLDELWVECEWGMPLLMPTWASTSVPTRAHIIEDYKNNWGVNMPIVHYGGEFVAGKRSALCALSKRIDEVYKRIRDQGFLVTDTIGDEFLLSMAANDYEVLSAHPFVRRYWTRCVCYGVDTWWTEVPVWHLPAEKNYGLIKIFAMLTKRKKFPSNEKAAAIFNLPKGHKYSIKMMQYYLYMHFGMYRKILT